MRRKLKFSISTTHVILFSFLAAILVGACLLALPVSSASGESVRFIDALFTATTATCVTGLIVAPTFSTWSIFGQVVILILIQIGGLGIITVISAITAISHRKMGLSERMLLQDAFNLNSLSGLSTFVGKVVRGTLIIEGIGALLYMTVFVPEFGARGIWISIFTSISAFCNAGIDIIAENSLCNYATNFTVNAVTSLLIILGGIGYIVWLDVIRVLRERKYNKCRMWKRLSLHSKIAISATALLILLGALPILIFEYNNPLTLENMSLPEKLVASLFQSVTTRTAGFATMPQENLTNASAAVSLLLMFVGGSPVGTAGGIKTVTFAVLIASAISAIKGKNEVTMFGRTISKQAAIKAAAVTFTSFSIMFISTVLLSAVTDASALDILYEATSATATVGLTRNLTPLLNDFGKLIITLTMYLGRVGPISLAVAFNLKKENQNVIKNPTENISVG